MKIFVYLWLTLPISLVGAFFVEQAIASEQSLAWVGTLDLNGACNALAYKASRKEHCPGSPIGRSDCRAMIDKNSELCVSSDCRAIIIKNPNECSDKDCEVYVNWQTKNCNWDSCLANCKGADCAALTTSRADLCSTDFCRAIVKKSPVLCN